MRTRKLRNMLITGGVMLTLTVIGLFAWRSQHLKSQAALVTVGMSESEAEAILGPPYMELQRQGARGSLAVWIDDFWQLDVLIDSDGKVERVTCVPSNSFYHRSVDWLKSWADW